MGEHMNRWIEELRFRGVKAAHPDDGWVLRESNEVTLTYPQFNDGLCVGDLLALGWPEIREDVALMRCTRLVRITGQRTSQMGITWLRFEVPDGA
jgi:hypothetical protein